MTKLPELEDYKIAEHFRDGYVFDYYRGSHKKTKEPVILKVIKSETRFFRDLGWLEYEASLRQNYPLAKIPMVLECMEVVRSKDSLIMVYKNFSGLSIKQYLLTHNISLYKTIEIIIKIAESVHELHKLGILFLDINPFLIMINDELQLKFIDLSNVVLLADVEAHQKRHIFEGKLAYSSPEQSGAIEKSISITSDCHDLGILFYEMLTGISPYSFDDNHLTLYAQCALKPLAAHLLDNLIPENVSDLVMKLLEKRPKKRYQSMPEIIKDLKDLIKKDKKNTFENIVLTRKNRIHYNLDQSMHDGAFGANYISIQYSELHYEGSTKCLDNMALADNQDDRYRELVRSTVILSGSTKACFYEIKNNNLELKACALGLDKIILGKNCDECSEDKVPMDILKEVFKKEHSIHYTHPDDYQGKLGQDILSKQDIQCMRCFPVYHKDELYGIFYIANRLCPKAYSDEKIESLMHFIHHSLTHIELGYLYEAEVARNLELKNQNKSLVEKTKKHKAQIREDIRSKASKIFVPDDPRYQRQFDLAQKAATAGLSILIQGETGTGKDILAQYVQEAINPESPMISIDCGAINLSISESELFGHTKGAFTDATEDRIGKFEMANGGILFLDEIGNMPMDIQQKLLRVLEDKKVIRVGSHEETPTDFLLIAATNKDLEKAIEDGEFREDLYYRINQVRIEMPSINGYPDTIRQFIDYFIGIYKQKYSQDFSLSQDVLENMCNKRWKGNLRELKNTMQTMVALNEPDLIQTGTKKIVEQALGNTGTENLKGRLASYEKSVIEDALNRHGGNVSKSAKALGVGVTTLFDKIKRLGIESAEEKN